MRQTEVYPYPAPIRHFLYTDFFIEQCQIPVKGLLLGCTGKGFPIRMRIPATLYQSHHFREHIIFYPLKSSNCFGKQLCLYPFYLFPAGGSQCRFSFSCGTNFHRIARHIRTWRTIDIERKHGECFGFIHISSPEMSRFIRMSIISQIQIEIIHIAEDDRITVIGYLIRYFILFPFRNSLPRIDTGCPLR